MTSHIKLDYCFGHRWYVHTHLHTLTRINHSVTHTPFTHDSLGTFLPVLLSEMRCSHPNSSM